jgi:hypothetical protein
MTTNSASKPNRLAGLYCRTSWHLRKNPRAAVLHDLAMQITCGGLTEFHLSRRQVAKYFGWGNASSDDAFNECEREGFFIRTVTGRGGRFGQPSFANSYTVLTHKQVAEEGKHPCLCAEEGDTRPLMGTGVSANGYRGAPQVGQHPSANGYSVYDLESPNKSTRESTNANPLSLSGNTNPQTCGQDKTPAEQLAAFAEMVVGGVYV